MLPLVTKISKFHLLLHERSKVFNVGELSWMDQHTFVGWHFMGWWQHVLFHNIRISRPPPSLTHCCCFYSLVGKLFCHEELPWTKHSNSSLSDRFCIKRNKSSKKDFFDVVPRLPNHQSDPKEFIHWVNLFYFSVFAFFITLKCFTSADQRGYLAQIKRLVRLIKFVKASVKFPPTFIQRTLSRPRSFWAYFYANIWVLDNKNQAF